MPFGACPERVKSSFQAYILRLLKENKHFASS